MEEIGAGEPLPALLPAPGATPSFGPEAREQRHARFVAGYVFLVVAAGSAAVAFGWVMDPGTLRSRTTAIALLALPALAACLVLARRGHARQGALASCAIMVLGAGAIHITAPHDAEAEASLLFLAVPLLTASLLLPARWTVAFDVAVLLSAVGMQALRLALVPDARGNTDVTLETLLVLVAGAGLAFSGLAATDIKAIEANAEALARANAQVRDEQTHRMRLLEQVAHDIASPLSPMLIQLTILQRRASDDGSRRALELVARNVQHLNRLVADVRDLAHLQTKGLSVALAPLDLAELARATVATFMPRAVERGIRLETAGEGPITVTGDAVRLSQLLNNLVSNALKFTPSGGRVQVRAGSGGGCATLEVIDEGCGLEPEQLGRLFKPFSQVHDPALLKQPEDRGSGLGLYISQGIMQAHGGRLEAASAGQGKGCIFTARLPILAPSEPPTAPASPTAPAWR